MKKHNILLILKILETESDKDHPITQLKIAEIISSVYLCDRKTIGRNIKFLKELGYPIVKTAQGYYLDSKSFTLDECNLVISSVRDNVNILEPQKQEIIEKLNAVLYKVHR